MHFFFNNFYIQYLYILRLTCVRFILHCDVFRKHCPYILQYISVEYPTHLLHPHPPINTCIYLLYMYAYNKSVHTYIFTCPFLAVHYSYMYFFATL